MSANVTLFQSDSSSASTGNAFDQSAFQDISLSPTNNMGYTDTLSTNPLGALFADDDSVRYGAKTLYIKDLILVADRALWINGKPTYSIIWNENFPAAQGYVFGNIQLNKGNYVSIRQAGDGIGLSGVFEKCGFIVTGDTAATADAAFSVDGVSSGNISFNTLNYALNDENANPLRDSKYDLLVGTATNKTHDIHGYQLTANQVSNLNILGVVVYSVNAGNNIDIFPGTSYVNKSQSTTTSGATLAIPSYSSLLGGRALYSKQSSGAYVSNTLPAMDIQSVATGSTGTNLLTVATGTGASFPVGSGIAAFWGSTGFVGSVTVQSTDTLTVSPTLSFGVSGLIYKTWSCGPSLAIQSSLMSLAYSYDQNQLQAGFSIFFGDSQDQFRIWGTGIGYTLTDSIWPSIVATNVTLGFLQIDGLFSAADIEYVGQGILHATFSVNGHPAYGINAGQTGSLKKTVFTDAGAGWNSFSVNFGASMGAIGINRINLYKPALPGGVSYGLLASLETLPTFIPPVNLNATNMAVGTFKRYYADEIPLAGSWLRGSTTAAAGGVQYIGFSSNLSATFQFFGKNFALIGSGTSLSFSVDGSAATFLAYNKMVIGATESFHAVAITNPAGSTQTVQAIDVTRTTGEIVNLQTFSAVPVVAPVGAQFWSGYHNTVGTWSSTSSAFVDPTVSGTATIVQRQSRALSVVTAPNNVAGISFNSASPDAAYLIIASVCTAVASPNSGTIRMTDGNTVIVQSGDIFVASGTIPLFETITISGMYCPGHDSTVTVKIQSAVSGGTISLANETLANPIEWTVVRIA